MLAPARTKFWFVKGYWDAVRANTRPKPDWMNEDYQWVLENQGREAAQAYIINTMAEKIGAPVYLYGVDFKKPELVQRASQIIKLWKKMGTPQRDVYKNIVQYSPNRFHKIEITAMDGKRKPVWVSYDIFSGFRLKPTPRGKPVGGMIGHDKVALLDWLIYAKASPTS